MQDNERAGCTSHLIRCLQPDPLHPYPRSSQAFFVVLPKTAGGPSQEQLRLEHPPHGSREQPGPALHSFR